MNTAHLLATLLSITLCIAPPVDLRAQTSDSNEQNIMRVQADNFLWNMPADLQQKQTSAILKAIDGDCTALTAVRNARNAQPKLSDNVDTRMITNNMRIYEPKDSRDTSLPVLLYLHGGGWTFGSINSCGKFCNAIAACAAIRVIALDYRLAPEHPYPAGLNDCIDAVEYIIRHCDELRIDISRITLGGDSSGGNLALATALSEHCRGKIESLLLFYPVTKAFDDGSLSWRKYGKGYGLDAEIMDAFNRAYTLNADARSEAISIGLCSDEALQALPRTLLVAAERDILCDQGKELAERMGKKQHESSTKERFICSSPSPDRTRHLPKPSVTPSPSSQNKQPIRRVRDKVHNESAYTKKPCYAESAARQTNKDKRMIL